MLDEEKELSQYISQFNSYNKIKSLFILLKILNL